MSPSTAFCSIVSLILRFYDASSGRLAVNGVSLPEMNVSRLRKQIGLVRSEFLGATRNKCVPLAEANWLGAQLVFVRRLQLLL